MAGQYRISRGTRRARKALRDRQQRQEMGDEAYDRMVAETKSPELVWVGLAFVVVLGVVFFTMT